MLTRNTLIASFALLGFSGFGSYAFAESAVLVQAPIDKVFVPQGFDDNDKVELIIHGQFPNSCYKMGPVDSTVDAANKKITISAEAYYYPGAVCTQMTVSFIKSVELKGALAAGSYKIEIAKRPEAETSALAIAKSTRPEADDYLYAAVQSAMVEEKTNGERNLILKGQHPYLFQGCVKFEQIKTYVSPSKVLVVQPITRIENDSDACTGEVNNRFEFKTPLKTALTAGEYVLHVRVLDGNSVNQLLEID